MKNNSINKIITAAALLLLAIAFNACKKTTSTATGTFLMHLHTDIDTNEVDDTTMLYKDATGRHLSISVAQFYVSNVVLTNVNGSTYTIKDARILKNIDSEQYVVGTAPVGTYSSVTFDVGLDAATNALQPSGFTTTGYIGNSSMWFGSTTQGFMFMKLQGKADTTTFQTGINPVPFSYEIGAATKLKTVTMPVRGSGAYATYQPYILTAGGYNYIHLIADYGKLLSVIDFKTQDSTDTYTTNPALSATIANNIPNMFRYEE